LTLEELLPHLDGITTAKELGKRILDLGVPTKFRLACAARDAMGFEWTDGTVRFWLGPRQHTEEQVEKRRAASRATNQAARLTLQGRDRFLLAAKTWGAKGLAAEYQRRRRTEIPQARAANRLRVRLHAVLAQKGGSARKANTLNLIGCTIDEFVAYIEAQFTDGMDWSNVHLDHKRPLASFDLSDPEQVREAMRWDNFQPLWPSDNLSKGSLHDGQRHRFTSRDS
jgi:hypothetical protein